MSIASRRRALIAAQNNEPKMIDGAKLEWEQGYYDGTTGAATESNYAIRLKDYFEVSNKDFIYEGPLNDGNGHLYYCYVYQYDSNYEYLGRAYVLENWDPSAKPIVSTSQNCAYVKLVFGMSSSFGIQVLPSSGNLVKVRLTAIGEEPTKLIDGTFTRGSSSWSVSNNVATISVFADTSSNYLSFRANRSISIVSGDSIRVLIKKTGGSVSGTIFVNCWVAGQTIVNKQWETGNTAFDQTITASSNGSSASLTFTNRSGQKTYTNYKCTISVYVNGTKVL